MYILLRNLMRGTLVDAADDDVLLSVFGHLRMPDVLSFASASATVAVRLDGAVAGPGSCAKGGGEIFGRQTLLYQLLIARLGEEVAGAAVMAASTGTTKGTGNDSTPDAPTAAHVAGNHITLLRALVSSHPVAKALALALELAGHAPGLGKMVDAGQFLDAFFRAEAWLRYQRDQSNKSSHTRVVGINAAADAAMTALVTCAHGDLLVRAAANALREAEHAMEDLYECCFTPSRWEGVARRRSAVEFLRGRLPGSDDPSSKAARTELEEATRELDDTIRGCAEEGFDLSCPRHMAGAPFTHWWLRISSTAVGSYGMCG